MNANESNDEGERGCMINTASIAAFEGQIGEGQIGEGQIGEGQIGQPAYTAAKAGITGMTRAMARNLVALGIRVMIIAPSRFATGLTKGIPDKGAQQLTKDAAFPRRMGKPREFAIQAMAIFEHLMMNGSTIRVDGGQRYAPR